MPDQTRREIVNTLPGIIKIVQTDFKSRLSGFREPVAILFRVNRSGVLQVAAGILCFEGRLKAFDPNGALLSRAPLNLTLRSMNLTITDASSNISECA